VLFSIAPLAIVLVSIFGLVPQDDSVRREVVNTIVDALPVSAAGRHDVERAVTAIATPASAVGLLSLLVFAWAASGMMTAIRQGLERALDVTETRPPARAKLVDLLLIVGTAVLVLVTVGITLPGQSRAAKLGKAERVDRRRGRDPGQRPRACGLLRSLDRRRAAALPVHPPRRLSFRDGLVGAIVNALLLRLISLASGWIYERTTRLSVVYGSLTSALVFLYPMYLYSSALLLGPEVAAAWSRPQRADGAPILTQLKRGLLGLFVRQKVPPADQPMRDGGPGG
jgi:uncharacterized BrkB/YihY/UPF0761 family membrane protein